MGAADAARGARAARVAPLLTCRNDRRETFQRPEPLKAFLHFERKGMKQMGASIAERRDVRLESNLSYDGARLTVTGNPPRPGAT